MTIERVTTIDHTGKRETLRLEIVAEGPCWIVGYRVDDEGTRDEAHFDGDTLVEVTRLIDVGTITRRVPLRINKHYGTLEVDR